MYDIECPYCNHEFKVDSEGWNEHMEEDSIEDECPKCEKRFSYSRSVTIHLESRKADCLNDGKHVFEQIVGHPKIHFRGKYECKYCSETRHVEEELATAEDYRKYFEEIKK